MLTRFYFAIMSKWKYANYHPEDYPSVKRNLESADMFDEVWDSQKNVDSLAAEEPTNVLVAEHDGGVVGSLFIDQFGSEVAFVYRVVVNEEHRGQGIATSLMQAARDALTKRGVREVALFVDAEDEGLQDFYSKQGFKKGVHNYKAMWRATDDEN